MPKVTMTTELANSPEAVWQAIGQFSAIGHWHPQVHSVSADGETKGSTRVLDLVGGGKIVEKLVETDPSERVYTYSIESGPLPVADYISVIKVKDNGNGTSSVEWSSEFKAKGVPENDAVNAIQEIYQQGLDNISKLYGMKS
ncbi:MAG: SRPBCC family protein [Pseudomonadota bacterium]